MKSLINGSIALATFVIFVVFCSLGILCGGCDCDAQPDGVEFLGNWTSNSTHTSEFVCTEGQEGFHTNEYVTNAYIVYDGANVSLTENGCTLLYTLDANGELQGVEGSSCDNSYPGVKILTKETLSSRMFYNEADDTIKLTALRHVSFDYDTGVHEDCQLSLIATYHR